MNIRCATISELTIVHNIVDKTIREIYPHYYPKGAVAFFLNHHNLEQIVSDIEAGIVYIYYMNGAPVGTVTIVGNEINRLFVLHGHHGRGFGGALIDFAENVISKSHDLAVLHASFPGKQMYLKRGYKEVEYRTIKTTNGDYLCVDIMEKQFNNK